MGGFVGTCGKCVPGSGEVKIIREGVGTVS